MRKEERPAWLETLWNVNPRLAERAEWDLDKLRMSIKALSEELRNYTNE